MSQFHIKGVWRSGRVVDCNPEVCGIESRWSYFWWFIRRKVDGKLSENSFAGEQKTFMSKKFSVPLTSESVTSGQAGGVFRQLFFQWRVEFGYKGWVWLQGLSLATRVNFSYKSWVWWKRLDMATRVGYCHKGRVWLQGSGYGYKGWVLLQRYSLVTRVGNDHMGWVWLQGDWGRGRGISFWEYFFPIFGIVSFQCMLSGLCLAIIEFNLAIRDDLASFQLSIYSCT